MSTILHLLRGQMSSPVNHLGGRCPHIPFLTGEQMSEGGNVRLPTEGHVLTMAQGHLCMKIKTCFSQKPLSCFLPNFVSF